MWKSNIFLLAFILGAGQASVNALTLTQAGEETDFDLCGENLLGISAVTIDPEPVIKGEDVKVHIEGTPTVDVPAADYDVKLTISFFGIALGHEHFDLCTEIEGVTCPITAGESLSGYITYPVPDDAPSGVVIKAKVEIKDEDSNKLVCVTTDVKVKESGELPFLMGNRLKTAHDRFGAEQVAKRRSRLSDSPYGRDHAALSWPIVEHINQLHADGQVGWKAHMSPRFEGLTVTDAKRIAGGTILKDHPDYIDLPARWYPTPAAESLSNTVYKGVVDVVQTLQEKLENVLAGNFNEQKRKALTDIPESFDGREHWPECAHVIGRVRDQSDCGSCWAFASTEAFNDRRCVKMAAGDKSDSRGDEDELTILSAEDTTACCRGIFCGLSMGCNGGQPGMAWRWFKSHGVVSGGDYSDVGAGTTCKPYEFQPCAHHVDPSTSGYPECPSGEYPTPQCSQQCSEGTFNTNYSADKRKASSSYSLRSITDIQQDLMNYGSVTAAFSVFSDFLTYSGGVYEHKTGEFMGGHAVKIIGWGTSEEGTNYWLVVNSWNNSWGEKGLFRILRGDNHCGIESQVVAGEA